MGLDTNLNRKAHSYTNLLKLGSVNCIDSSTRFYFPITQNVANLFVTHFFYKFMHSHSQKDEIHLVSQTKYNTH